MNKISSFFKKKEKPTNKACFIRNIKEKDFFIHFYGKNYFLIKGIEGACIWENKEKGESFIRAFDEELECVLVSEILK